MRRDGKPLEDQTSSITMFVALGVDSLAKTDKPTASGGFQGKLDRLT